MDHAQHEVRTGSGGKQQGEEPHGVASTRDGHENPATVPQGQILQAGPEHLEKGVVAVQGVEPRTQRI